MGQTLLSIAIYRGHKDLVDFLIQKPSLNLNLKDDNGDMPIHYAAKLDLVESIKIILLREPKLINAQNNCLKTPLHLAIETKSNAITNFLLLQPNVDVNIKDLNGNLPIHFAAQHNLIDGVELLLHNDPSTINTRNSRNDTPLSLAMDRNHQEMIKLLLSRHNLDLNIAYTQHGKKLIHYAAETNSIDVVKLLVLQNGEGILNIRDRMKETPLSLAVKRNHVEMVRFLLKYPTVDVTTENIDGKMPIHLVLSVEVLEQLLSKNHTMVNALNKQGKALLHLAIERNQIEMVRFLLKQPFVDINVENIDGNSPMQMAIQMNSIDLVQLLLTFDRNLVNLKNPIWMAIEGNCVEIVKFLLKQPDINLNIQNISGDSPIHYAVKKELLDVIMMLLSKEESLINNRDLHSQTPLHQAVKSSKHDILNFLLKQSSIDFNIRDNKGNLAIHNAAGTTLSSVDLLLRHQSDLINAGNIYNQTPLCIAMKTKKQEIIDYLLDQKFVDINITDCKGNLPIHYAAAMRQVETAQSLLKLHGNINVKNNNKQTPLHVAASEGRCEMLEFLLKQPSIDCKPKDQHRNLPIHYAAAAKESEAARLLLRHWPHKINSQNEYKQTPLHLAAMELRFTTVQFLLNQPSIDDNIKDAEGNLPIHYAVNVVTFEEKQLCDSTLLLLLSTHKNMINSQNKYKYTPLHIAIISGREEKFRMERLPSIFPDPIRNMRKWNAELVRELVLKILLNDRRVDVHIRDKSGSMPIHYAAKYYDFESIRLLVKFDITLVNAKTKEGQTPLDIVEAERYRKDDAFGYSESVKILTSDVTRLSQNITTEW